MSSSVLEKLKAKPVAKKIEQVKIKIVQPGIEEKIEIKTKITINNMRTNSKIYLGASPRTCDLAKCLA